jgi:hypothetical protein
MSVHCLASDPGATGLIGQLCARSGHSAPSRFRAFPTILRGHALPCVAAQPSVVVPLFRVLVSDAVSKLRLRESRGRQVLRCLRHSFAAAMPRMQSTQSDDRKILQRMRGVSSAADATPRRAPPRHRCATNLGPRIRSRHLRRTSVCSRGRTQNGYSPIRGHHGIYRTRARFGS